MMTAIIPPVSMVSTAVKQRDIGLMETNMITIPNAPMIGGKRRGIWTPGAVTIGRVKAGSQNVVIDLTTTQLDSRLTYTGPAHSYLGSDGKLSTSAENEWPIEYVNGVAVGRHEPEPAATNLFGSIMLENMTSLPGSDGFTEYRESGSGSVFHRTQFRTSGALSGNITYSLMLMHRGRNNLAFRAGFLGNTFQNIGINNRQVGYVGSGYVSASTTIVSDEAFIFRAAFPYFGANNGLLTSPTSVTDDSVPVVIADTAAGFSAAYPQIEAGTLATSPIISAAGAQGKRAASSVTVQTAGFSSLLIHFSDGTSDTHQITGDTFKLPPATNNWGERYIQRIEMRK
ncbi:hypothetical protein [Mixta calida]|uniref:hypothetical protein n=1 Tax=Mixta calida TaxID=665913 RepID=UPI002FDB03FF